MNLMNNSTPLGATQYTYDTMSRLATVSDGANTATYARIAGMNLLDTTTVSNTSAVTGVTPTLFGDGGHTYTIDFR